MSGPIPRIGNELYPYGAVKSSLDFTLRRADLDEGHVATLCREAETHLPAAVCLPLPWIEKARRLLKGSPVRLTAVIENGELPREIAQTGEAIREGADEIDVPIDVQALKRGEFNHVQEELRDVIDAAQGREVKVTVEAPQLSEEELRAACRLSESAGAKFVKTDAGRGAPVTLDQVRIMKESCNLGIEVASAISNLAACREILKLIGPGRPVRFESDLGYKLAGAEERELQDEFAEENKKLQSSLFTEKGMKAFHESQAYLKKLRAKIEAAHVKGIPVIYLSVPVRSNEMGKDEENRALHQGLVEDCRKAGVEYIDPFNADDELEFLKDAEMDPVLTQELLMDPESGVWPNALKACDGIAHDDAWKYSLGAKTEHLLARRYGVPVWDRKSKPSLKH